MRIFLDVFSANLDTRQDTYDRMWAAAMRHPVVTALIVFALLFALLCVGGAVA